MFLGYTPDSLGCLLRTRKRLRDIDAQFLWNCLKAWFIKYGQSSWNSWKPWIL